MLLDEMSRKALQALAKTHGIKANAKSATLRAELAAILGSGAVAPPAAPQPTADMATVAAASVEASDDINALSRRELQALAKANGISANGKSDNIRAALRAMFASPPAAEVVEEAVEEIVAAPVVVEEFVAAPVVPVVAAPVEVPAAAPVEAVARIEAAVPVVEAAVPPSAKIERRRSGRIAKVVEEKKAAVAAKPAASASARRAPLSKTAKRRFNRPTASSASRKGRENARPAPQQQQVQPFKARKCPNFKKLHQSVTASGLKANTALTLREEGRLLQGKKRGRTPSFSGRKGPRAPCAGFGSARAAAFGAKLEPRFAAPTSSSRNSAAKARKKFDLKASLAKKPTWSMHSGRVGPIGLH